MSDITERLRQLYVQNGTNYVQEAADEIENLRDKSETLRAEVDVLNLVVKDLVNKNGAINQIADNLKAERDAAVKDAERYRYLRNRKSAQVLEMVGPAAGCWIDCDDEDGGLCLLTGQDADAAIDAIIDQEINTSDLEIDIVNKLRMYAEDLHSASGFNGCSAAMSLAADEIERLRDYAEMMDKDMIATINQRDELWMRVQTRRGGWTHADGDACAAAIRARGEKP